MAIKTNQPLIPAERVQDLLQAEPALVITALAIGSLIVYQLLLRDLSVERHRNLKKQFANLGYHFLAATFLFGAYIGLQRFEESVSTVQRINTYLGLMALIQECIVAIKTARIFIFEYLYLSHMRVAFPLLLVNLFTLLLTVIISAWLASTIFAIRIAPLVATSAVFSLVLGLALQDTIGNLFAGVALQFDKPYEIGDWIEIHNNGSRWVGQVTEISWRATVLQAFTDETITIPNKIMSQAQISNFSAKHRPFIRGQVFKLPFESPSDQVKRALLDATSTIKGIRKEPKPIVLITETGDAWVHYKLIYYLEDFGAQYIVGDQVIETALNTLKDRGLSLANPRLALMRHTLS